MSDPNYVPKTVQVPAPSPEQAEPVYVEDILNHHYFTHYLQKQIDEVLGKRGEPRHGLRFKKDWLDHLGQEGFLTEPTSTVGRLLASQSAYGKVQVVTHKFQTEFLRILDKTSKLSSSLRTAIKELCYVSFEKTAMEIKKEKEEMRKKEENPPTLPAPKKTRAPRKPKVKPEIKSEDEQTK